ncbi:DAK2 domain-containing protein [Arthrobacter crusticola]|uniref:DAK2 domain-containing protein n=1 Tax=Arthrobacter crusticola TaxID=2547960 RepID=A0A4R5TZL2_9MICC|nr:DAK2 domain-containing protein [Arthrobacter crusticola]TDK26631.1 DAK2 domain-containing protein [Arthrobacter crusticola]
MDGAALNLAIRNSLAEVTQYADELRDLDAALGDGDLGVTVSLGAKAVIQALEELPDDALPAEIAKTCAKAFANANPSTMAALVAGALLAGSRVWGESTTVSIDSGADFIAAAADSIGKRGKSQVGDKTILDALAPTADALRGADTANEALDRAILAAGRGVRETIGMQSMRGRASWLQERSIGLQDPGATALLRFLEAWRDAN